MVQEIIMLLVFLAIPIVAIAGMWKTFTKANKAGWAAIIPIYNAWVLVKISDNTALWFVLLLIPIVQFIAAFKVSIDVAKNFGKGTGFGIALVILPFIFFPILGFGDAQYQGSGGAGGQATAQGEPVR